VSLPREGVVDAIRVSGLSVAYAEAWVLHEVSIGFRRGALTAIVGPNGAGKTTLIQAILGLVRPVSGSVHILGEDIERGRRQVAYIPQRGAVDWDFPTTVLDVVLMGTYGSLGWFRRPGSPERERARAALEQVGMSDLGDRQIGALSGGQQQRVFLARALVQNAPVYLMDEPFQGVDARTEQALVSVMKTLRDRGDTLVVVHHALHTVPDYFDDVVLLNVGIVAAGAVSEVFTEANVQACYGGTLPFIGTGR
jgi:manganese/zinc/iron transport system ATP- binding protein